MEKKDIQKVAVIFGIILLMAIVFDIAGGQEKEENFTRKGIGEENQEIELLLHMSGTEDVYEYILQVKPMQVTQEQAQEFFETAIEEIDENFNARKGMEVPRKETYANGIVEAKWKFDPGDVVNAQGELIRDAIPEEGMLIQTEVTLSCGAYEEIYQFAFAVQAEELSTSERVLLALDQWVRTEMEKEGEDMVYLPTELEGVALSWSRQKESLTLRVILLEILAVVALLFSLRLKKEREEKRRVQSVEADYPELVGQLSLLLGAGMTMRQAWNRISAQYSAKREKAQIKQKPAFEGVLRMNRRVQEGENEKIAYQKWGSEMQHIYYSRLVRLLVTNLEKGSSGICMLLEMESKQAYEQKIIQAKKMGEEASTKMLLPLMLMMVVVMAIVMLPALIGFAK